MIDSHCHLDRIPLINNIDDIIKRSKKNGVQKFLTICVSSVNFKDILKIVQNYENVYGSFGIHPHETKHEIVKKETIVKNVTSNSKIIGIGETGLDFFYENSDKKSQIKSFENHIEASIDLSIPLIIHSRDAEKDMYEILNHHRSNNLKILMHCFTGSEGITDKLLNLNTYFSASGIITFKNSQSLQKVFKKIPNDRLLIETDSPFLAPEPMRGKKNEPSFIKYILEKLALLKGITPEEMDEITTKNFKKLFNLNEN